VASGLANWEDGLWLWRSLGSVLIRPGPTLDVRRRKAGCEARGKAEGPLFRPGVTGKGQTGRVNCLNLRRCFVMHEPRSTACWRGVGASRCEAAGADRGFFVGRASTAAPEIQEAPSPVASRACGTWEPRWGPDAATCPGQPTARKAHSPARLGRPGKRMPATEREQEVGA
jgi:hypothetical protein